MLKTDREIVDDFVDDYYSGYIEWDGRNAQDTYHKDSFQNDIKPRISLFITMLWGYRKLKDAGAKEQTASEILLELNELRVWGFFPFTQSSIKLLKVEIAKLKEDNRRLATELDWYHKSEAQSQQGVRPNAT